MPLESALVLILLRWPTEVRSLETLELGKTVSHPELNKSELDMAKRLIEDMAAKWEPDEYEDSFQEKIMALVDKKVHEGKVENVEPVDSNEERKSADIIDLTELLKRSLGGKPSAKTSSTKVSSAKVSSAKVKPISKAKPSTTIKKPAAKKTVSPKSAAKSKGTSDAKKASSARPKKSAIK